MSAPSERPHPPPGETPEEGAHLAVRSPEARGPRPSLEVLEGWGMANHARSWVYRPRSPAEAADALEDARSRGLTVAHRGGGLSYGDAALNQGGAVLDLSGMDRVLDVDAAGGTVRAEAGATVGDVWRAALPGGWWPPVVPGTQDVTLGGAAAMNVHGKNHVASGTFADHVEAVRLLSPGGRLQELRRGPDDARLRRVLGGMGLSGTILELTLRMKRVHSGYLEVQAAAAGSLSETLEALDEGAERHEYAVAWIDAMPGRRPGRGILHYADPLPEDHPRAHEAMDPARQALPARILGVVPRDRAWRALALLTHDPGMRALNAGRWWAGRLRHGRTYLQTHAAFHFLLDYVPGWKRAYRPHGLVQYQLFVPRISAFRVFSEALALQREHGVRSYLGVVKRHRTDEWAGRYTPDGFSLALDFPVRPHRLGDLMRLLRGYDALLAEAGGSIYAAKDSVGRGRLPDFRHPLYSSNLVRRWEAPG